MLLAVQQQSLWLGKHRLVVEGEASIRPAVAVKKCYIHIFQQSTCAIILTSSWVHLIAERSAILLLYILKDIWHETHLSRGLTVLRPLDPSLLSLCYISGIISPSSFSPQHCHADNTRHTTLPAFLFSLPSWAPSLTGCLTAAFKFNLDKAAVLHFKSAPSRTFLCGIILLHLRVFGCYIMQHVLGKTESGCLFKWQLYPRGLPALCVFWLCVHLCCLYKSLPLFSGNYWIPFLYWYGGT